MGGWCWGGEEVMGGGGGGRVRGAEGRPYQTLDHSRDILFNPDCFCFLSISKAGMSSAIPHSVCHYRLKNI